MLFTNRVLVLIVHAMQVYRCYKGIFSYLSDSVRCVVVCDSIEHIEAFMRTLAKESFTLADKPPTLFNRILRLGEVYTICGRCPDVTHIAVMPS